MTNKNIEKAAILAACDYDNPDDEPCYDKNFYDGFIEGANYALAHQWVSVEERLPEDNQQVIASFLNGGISLGYYDYSDCLWFIDGLGAYNKYEISHWMSIPIPQLNPEKE